MRKLFVLTLSCGLLLATACGGEGSTEPVLEDGVAPATAQVGEPDAPDRESRAEVLDDAAGEAFVCSPSALLIGNAVPSLTLHTNIQVRVSVVDRDSLRLFGLGADPIAPSATLLDSLGNLVVRFDAQDVLTIVATPSTELTLVGTYLDGRDFSASSTLVVMD